MGYHPPYCDPSTFIFALLYLNDGFEVPTYRRRVTPGYKIHGLWPERCVGEPSNQTYPSYCRKVHFNRTALNGIYNKLQKVWYPDAGLLQHEWVKHGSCCNNLTEYEYFERVLKVWGCIPFKQECRGKGEECRLPITAKQVQNCISTR